MHRITEPLAELLWELYSVILVEELPNRNSFGINSVIFSCAMVIITNVFLWVYDRKPLAIAIAIFRCA